MFDTIDSPGRPVNDFGPAIAITQNGPAPELKVTWTYPGLTEPADTGALVGLYRLDDSTWNPVTSRLCASGCTSMMFYYLERGQTYRATVTPLYGGSPGPVMTSARAVIDDPCPARVCVGVDTGRVIGPADHAAQGILHATGNGSDQAYLPALEVSMYRDAVPYGPDGKLDWSQWPTNLGDAQSTLLVSDAWWQVNGGNPPAPTDAELPQYADWLGSYVQAVLSSGYKVDYWEPVNEPGTQYYSSSVSPTVTATELYNLFLVSYDVIKAQDPTARIIGPSLAKFEPYADGSVEDGFNMTDFLNFASDHNLDLAAVNWHDNGTDPLYLADAVTEVRQMIAARPNLGHPLVFINEYGSRDTQRIPGWDVAYLTSLTDSRVASAGRSCWLEDCEQSDLDGLLTPDGTGTLPDYYVRSYYGAMTGTMIATDSTSDHVTSIASYDRRSSVVRVLVGRGVGYADRVRSGTDGPPPARSVPVSVSVKVPWSSGSVEVDETDISGEHITTYSPAAATHRTLPITAYGDGTGIVTTTIPAFADGDAWTLTLTPRR